MHEISVMLGKLPIAFKWASLIFQLRFLDDACSISYQKYSQSLHHALGQNTFKHILYEIITQKNVTTLAQDVAPRDLAIVHPMYDKVTTRSMIQNMIQIRLNIHTV